MRPTSEANEFFEDYRISRWWRYAGLAAMLSFTIALTVFGALLDGYSQRLHPVGLLGAEGIPRAVAFNAAAFVLPGVLAAWLAWGLREALSAQAVVTARIGSRLVFLSAMAFAAQGLLPLDPTDLDASATRLHAVAWMLWWIAFAPGVLLLAWAAWRSRPRRIAAFAVHLLAAGMVLCFALFAGDLASPAIAQRIALAVWFGWLLVMPGFDDTP